MVTDQLILEFFQKISDKDSAPFHFINGTYGVGKSHLMEKTLEHFKGSNFSYIALIFRLENLQHFSQLPDFLAVQTNLNPGLEKMIFDEVSFFKSHFNDLLNNFSVNADDGRLKKNISEYYSCFDYFQTEYLFQNYPPYELEKLAKKISSLFEKNIDKRVLLYFFEVQAESLLAPILNTVLQNNQNELKPFVYLFFDDYETSAGTIDWWIFNTFAPFLNKTLNDFIAYKFSTDGIEVSALIDLKFILFSRYNFSIQKFKKILPHLKYSLTTIQPFKQDEVNKLIIKNNISTQFQPNEIIDKTYGIYFNYEILIDLNFNLSSLDTKSKYLKKLWEKISSKISHPLQNFLKFSSALEVFSEEFVRFAFTNYHNYHRLFQYFIDEKEIFQVLHPESLLISLKSHYFEIIKEVVSDYYTHSDDLTLIKLKFKCFYDNYGNFSLRERKILRSLAYLEQFDFGYVLQKVFGDDYDSVKIFVQNNPELFDNDDNIFKLKESNKKCLTEINRLVDGDRFEQKRAFLEEMVHDFHSFAKNEVASLRNEFETLLNEIQEVENKLEMLKKDRELLLSKILSKQNDLNLLRDKYSKIGKKVPAVIFILLVISSILLYSLGNNFSHFFNRNLQNDFVGGLGIALKFLGITLFGAFVYLIINFLTGRTRYHHYESLKMEINLIEKEYYSLKNNLTTLKQEINILSESLEQKTKKKQEVQKKISEYQKAQHICYISTT
ncbi:MAG: hypothetical protein ACUVQ1_04360 [Candidatus Kapaibacteriales bacterium]